jgi:hypothetical protein
LPLVTPCAENAVDCNPQELKISEEKMRCLIVSEQQANCYLDDLKGQLETQAVHYRVSVDLYVLKH